MSESVEPTLVEICKEGIKPVDGGDLIPFGSVELVCVIPYLIQYEHSKSKEIEAKVDKLVLEQAKGFPYVGVKYADNTHRHKLEGGNAILRIANFHLYIDKPSPGSK